MANPALDAALLGITNAAVAVLSVLGSLTAASAVFYGIWRVYCLIDGRAYSSPPVRFDKPEGGSLDDYSSGVDDWGRLRGYHGWN